MKNTLSALPDLAKSFAVLKIAIDLRNVVPYSAIAVSIHKGLEGNKNPMPVIAMLYDQIKDNRELMVQEIGEELVASIENLFKN